MALDILPSDFPYKPVKVDSTNALFFEERFYLGYLQLNMNGIITKNGQFYECAIADR